MTMNAGPPNWEEHLLSRGGKPIHDGSYIIGWEPINMGDCRMEFSLLDHNWRLPCRKWVPPDLKPRTLEEFDAIFNRVKEKLQ